MWCCFTLCRPPQGDVYRVGGKRVDTAVVEEEKHTKVYLWAHFEENQSVQSKKEKDRLR